MGGRWRARLAVFAVAASFSVASASCGGSGSTSSFPQIPPGGGSPSSTPSAEPSPTQSVSPAAPLNRNVITDTWNGIAALQQHDFHISDASATEHATRYAAVWGAGKADAWRSGNARLNLSYYLPFDTDANVNGFGNLGHDMKWWKNSSGHADWILYRCDKSTPAWPSGLESNVPLDISNPAVVEYQMRLVGPYIEQHAYNGLAADVLSLNNANGGCGVWTKSHTVWVSRFSGDRVDSKWAAAVQYWVAYAQWYLHGLSKQVTMMANSPMGSVPEGDPAEKELISHLDAFHDEAGFTSFGGKRADDQTYNDTIWWAKYVQNLGKAFFVVDLWSGDSPTPAEREYAVATYLMLKGHQAALFTSKYGMYGNEFYWPEFTEPVGAPCGSMYATQNVYFRKSSGGLAIVNTSKSLAFAVTLPKAATNYTDIEGTVVTNPLTIAPQSGVVLLTSNGCN